ncbi:MAG: CPBP family intramembrane metalloprotease [Caldilineaceae bacterium]|nr:CPBP family intramembrane metalloprotease [Caldilineaceae bacterium]
MSQIMGVVVTFVPLILIIFVANIAQARREKDLPYGGFAAMAYLSMMILYAGGFLAGLLFQLGVATLRQQPELAGQITEAMGGIDLFGMFESPMLFGAGLWVSSLIGLVLLLKPVRRFCARFMPLDPESPVHAIALSWTMLVIINLAMTLGVGLGNMTEMVAATEEMEGAADVSSMTMITLWTQQILTALLALVGVGWLTRLSWQGALTRVGVVRPSMRQAIIGVAFGLAMVPVVVALGALAAQFNIGVDPDVDALTEELLGPLFTSAFGILTLGLAAALGEETIFRGAVQPRFGILVTALLFALLHSNYGITISTLIVFILGLMLGYLRMRHNTTTAMIMHAVYNMSLGLISLLGMSWMDV